MVSTFKILSYALFTLCGGVLLFKILSYELFTLSGGVLLFKILSYALFTLCGGVLLFKILSHALFTLCGGVLLFKILSYALFTLCGGVLLFGEEVTQVNEDMLSVSESKRFDDSLMLNDSNNDVLKLGIPHELVLSMQCIFDCSCSYILRGTNLRNYHMQLRVDSIL
jgi:hypothetical protein